MPAAALLGGIAVPAIALTVGWQWAYVLGAVACVVAIVVRCPADAVARRTDARSQRSATGRPAGGRPDLGTTLLVLYAVVGLLGATNAGAMVGFITSGAEASRIESRCGRTGAQPRFVRRRSSAVSCRGGRSTGRASCRSSDSSGCSAWAGSACSVLAVDAPITYLLAPIPAFAFGWAWPGLFNLSVVRNNPSAPAAATGHQPGRRVRRRRAGTGARRRDHRQRQLPTALAVRCGDAVRRVLAGDVSPHSDPGEPAAGRGIRDCRRAADLSDQRRSAIAAV